MGILDRLFGRKAQQETVTKSREEIQAECSHATLLGRWDSVDDMGKEDKAVRFVCDSCHAEFSPEDTERIREGHATRLREQLRAEEATAAEEAAAEAKAAESTEGSEEARPQS